MKISTVIILFSSFLSLNSYADDDLEVLYNTPKLTLEAAQVIAQNSIKECRKQGAQISVVVLDGGGHIQVLLRDRLASFLTPEGAILKAKTAINFKSATSTFSETVINDPKAAGIDKLPGIILLGGGLPIEAAGSIIGAIGVAGAPNGDTDETCAQAGLQAIQEELDFAE